MKYRAGSKTIKVWHNNTDGHSRCPFPCNRMLENEQCQMLCRCDLFLKEREENSIMENALLGWCREEERPAQEDPVIVHS